MNQSLEIHTYIYKTPNIMLVCLLKFTEKESFGNHYNLFLSSKHKI